MIAVQEFGKFFGLAGKEKEPRQTGVGDFRAQREVELAECDELLGRRFEFVGKDELVEVNFPQQGVEVTVTTDLVGGSAFFFDGVTFYKN